MTALGAGPGRVSRPVAVCAVLFVAALSILHVLRPDLDPAAHMLSEYALGPVGGVMGLAFMALSALYVALFVALRDQLRGAWGRLGQAALLLAATGAAMGGFFPMDPVGTPPDQYSLSGRLHGLAFMVGGPGALLAATFVNVALAQRPGWRPWRAGLLWSAVMVWAVYLAFSAAVALLMSGSHAADNLVGWLNRALVSSWVAWGVVVARRPAS